MMKRRRRLVVAIVATAALLGGGGLALSALFQASRASDISALRALPEVPATAMDRVAANANNSPKLISDPTDEDVVVMAHRLDAPNFGCALEVSGDGGRGWVEATPVPYLPEGAEKCYAPEVAFDGSGTLYYLYVGLAGMGNEPVGAFLTTSADRGKSFSPPHRVLGPANFAVRMAIDPDLGKKGRVHLVWLHASTDPPLGGFGPPPNPILTAHSDDGGRTFSKPQQVSDVRRQRVVAPALALGPNHAVHVAYYDLGGDVIDYQGLEGDVWDGKWSLVLSSSRNAGIRFDQAVVEASVVPPERVMLVFTMPPPALVADRHGRICVAWTDGRHGDPDAFAKCAADQKTPHFGRAIRLNDDAIGNGRSQYQPQLSATSSGRVDAIFYDRRSSLQNLQNDVSFTYSIDGGDSFAANRTLNRWGSSDVRIGPEYAVPSAQGQVEFGSRMGLLSFNSAALAAWTDTRNALRLTTDQDIFTTKVVGLPSRRWSMGWGLPAGIALILSSLVTLGLVEVRRRRNPKGNE